MFQRGNHKLGSKILAFSIPADSTCPGKTAACSKECYAKDGFFLMPNVRRSLTRNWDETKEADFADRAIAELIKLKAKVCRINVSGDLYDKACALNWLKICRAVPQCRFFIYSRSWRIPDIRPVITKLSRLSNVRVWWSVDKDTGMPKNKPATVRLAYMQTGLSDVPTYPVDLFFRVDKLVPTVTKKINNTLVCPVENGITKDMNCMKCGYCWRDKGEVINWSTKKLTISLPVV